MQASLNNIEITGEDVKLTKIIDDNIYQNNSYNLRKFAGNGFIKEKGEVLARHALSIPLEEFGALLMQNDPDAVAWWKDKNDKKALRRLVERYPHWRIATRGI